MKYLILLLILIVIALYVTMQVNFKSGGKEETEPATEPVAIRLNPPLYLEKVKYDGKTFTLVQDGVLPGGTKQRGASVIGRLPYEEIVYSGPWNGFAQVALAIAARHYGKRATIVMTRNDYWTNKRAKKFGGNHFKIILGKGSLKDLGKVAEKYVKRRNAQAGREVAYILPFGLESDEFIQELADNIREAAKDTDISLDTTQRVWVTGGSATLYKALCRVFPHAKFGIVQVGRTIWPDMLDQSRTTLYVAPEQFYHDAVDPPPYNSVITYDAKLWQFAKHGEDGDIIWNVGAEKIPFSH